jgi:lysophospholipase L1-like esterase
MLKFTKNIVTVVILVFCGLFLNKAYGQKFANWENEISAFAQADKTNPPKKGSIVFTGSSSIRLWENLGHYFPDKNILNRGFGGSQTEEVAYFADRIITPYKPRQVVIYVGDNDLAAGKTPEKVLNDFKDLFRNIRKGKPRAAVTYISIKPSPSRIHLIPQIRQTNDLIRNFLATQKRATYVDVFTPMLKPNGKPKPELFKPDSLHMTAAGYDIWAQVLRPYLK